MENCSAAAPVLHGHEGAAQSRRVNSPALLSAQCSCATSWVMHRQTDRASLVSLAQLSQTSPDLQTPAPLRDTTPKLNRTYAVTELGLKPAPGEDEAAEVNSVQAEQRLLWRASSLAGEKVAFTSLQDQNNSLLTPHPLQKA